MMLLSFNIEFDKSFFSSVLSETRLFSFTAIKRSYLLSLVFIISWIFLNFLSKYCGVQNPIISKYIFLLYFSKRKSGINALPLGNIRGSGSLISFQPVRNFSN